MLVYLHFLVGVAPIFTRYLKIFQTEAPLVHCIFDELKTMTRTLLARFLKPEVLKDKTAAELMKINLDDDANYLQLGLVDFGSNAKTLVRKQVFCFIDLYNNGNDRYL